MVYFLHRIIWDKVFKNELSKICGTQPLKNLERYGLLKAVFHILLVPFLNALTHLLINYKIEAMTPRYPKKPAKAFSCEFCNIYKNTSFTEHLRTTAFEIKKFWNLVLILVWWIFPSKMLGSVSSFYGHFHC